MPPEECPNCGAEVPPNAKSCPECGSDESTGWSDQAHADNLGIPDENFDYDRFVEEEFGEPKKQGAGLKILGAIVAGIVIVLLVAYFAGLARF